jgi:hypothetical protein
MPKQICNFHNFSDYPTHPRTKRFRINKITKFENPRITRKLERHSSLSLITYWEEEEKEEEEKEEEEEEEDEEEEEEAEQT